jgi:hypothetical protein
MPFSLRQRLEFLTTIALSPKLPFTVAKIANTQDDERSTISNGTKNPNGILPPPQNRS